jgi:hypothetical protein
VSNIVGDYKGAVALWISAKKWLMLLVLQALSAAPSHLHSIGHFVESIHHELGSFRSTSFAHCRREANGWLILLHKKLLFTV